MTKQQMTQLIEMLQAEYPSHRIDNPESLLFSWAMQMADVPFEAGAMAAAAWIRSGERFFPTSGQLFQLVATESGAVPSMPNAWEMVLCRMRTTYPGFSAPPWDAPPSVKEALKAMGGMHVVRVSENIGVERSQFAKMYEVYRQRAVRSADLSEATIGDGTPALGVGDA